MTPNQSTSKIVNLQSNSDGKIGGFSHKKDRVTLGMSQLEINKFEELILYRICSTFK